MLIGTWNLDAKWSRTHAEFLANHECDVWLLTEVSPLLHVDGYALHVTAATMARGQAWAGVLTRLPRRVLADPHPASAAVQIVDNVFCSSVLPWASCGSGEPWSGESVGAKTAAAVAAVASQLPVSKAVWGGDWNHTLTSAYWGTSRDGRDAITRALDRLGLVCLTTALPHRLPKMTSIDHIAIPTSARLHGVRHIAVPPRLSDHDAYLLNAHLA
jgi:hypothetical protein